MALSAPKNVMVIGVGGTGKWILTHLKRSLIHANNHWLVNNSPLQSLDPEYGQTIPDGIKLLCLDLDNKAEGIDDIALEFDQNMGKEFINFKTNLSAIKKDVENHQGKDRWPWFEGGDGEDATKLTLPLSGQEEQGAGQQRHFSRLSLLENLRGDSRFLRIIDDHFFTFSNRHRTDQSIANYFIIVGSIAGGTGSGTILDIAQILKHKIENGALPNSNVIGITVLSETFTGTFKNLPNQWELIQANCLAAMREIRRFLVLRNSGYPFMEYDHNWNPRPKVTDSNSPLDVCFVVDGTRPQGQHLTNFSPQETLYPAVADYLANMCLQQDRPFDPANTRNIIGNTSEGVFSTLGCHSWVFPADDIIKDFSIQLSQSFISDLRSPALPPFDWDGLTDRFLTNSENFYSQNSPTNEHYKGVTTQNQKLGLLNQLSQMITDKKKSNVAPSIDFNFFTESIFAPNNFPLRFKDPNINVNLIDGYQLPTLNLDYSGANDTDFFSSNPDIAGTNEQQQVVQLAKELMIKNIGTSSDTIYNKDQKDTLRTYHSILEYYRKTAGEIFGGYQDHKGNYYPGLVENQIFLILNRMRKAQPVLDELTQKPVTLPITGSQKYDVDYETNQCPIDTARQFCQQLITKLQTTKDIIDEAYHIQFCSTGKTQVIIDQEDVNRREYEYLNANRLMVMFKKSPYLESMQRFLLSQRLEVMKRTLTAIIEDFVQILNGWLEALNNFDGSLSALQEKLSRMYDDFSNVRTKNEVIKTRTYLTTHRSSFEQNLYKNLIETTIEQTMREGQAVNISNKDKYNEKSFVHIGPNPSDVNTRPGMKRTGRILSVHFRHAKIEEVLSIPEIALKYARFFCQGVRNTNFWNTLVQYRDDNGNLRYRLDQQLPSLLTGDIVTNSNAFINYNAGKRSSQIGGTNDANLVIYADGATASASGIEFNRLQETLRPHGFSTIYNANIYAGQQHQITAMRQIYNLTIDSLHSFGKNLDIYRRWLLHTYLTHGNTSTGTPLHNFLGEKNASRYEQFIMNHWQDLGLDRPVNSDFFLPLESILALEKVEDVKKFLWAGIHMNKLYWAYDAAIGDHYAIKDDKGQLIPLVSKSKDLLGALLLFVMPNDSGIGARLDPIKNEIEQNYKTFLTQKNTSRATCRATLDSYGKDPINNIVLQTGMNPPVTKQIVTSPGVNPNQISSEEKLNLLFKAFLVEMC
jgi:hypothetical protein